MYRDGDLQKTIIDQVEYSGIALHTGNKVNIRCLPTEADTGVIFRRIDLPDKPEIKAEPWQVVSTKRCTSIGIPGEEGVQIHTIEHIMAALWALEIDNIIIEIDGPETPVADGSALPFVNLFKKAGVQQLRSTRKIWVIENPIWVKRGHMYMVVLPGDDFKISYTLDYDNPVIGTQFYEFNDRDSFIKEIAPARTYGFEKEVDALHRRGLALGGSLDNAVLIGEEGTVNPLRFPDEFVRHKILDVIGDMALNGFISGHIITVRSGHSLHVELAQQINQKLIKQESD